MQNENREVSEKISIIVPVYNSEQTIVDCINSIIYQDFTNIEVLIIDDGSTDKTQDIISDNFEHYKQINYFRIENSGVSYARNYGLSKATGEYICFIDSDDIMNPRFLQMLSSELHETKADIAICGYTKYLNGCEDTQYLPIIKKKELKIVKTVDYEQLSNIYCNKLMNPVWNKMYKRSILHKVYFDESLAAGEDLLFNLHAINNADSIVLVTESLYNYYYDFIKGYETQLKRCNFETCIKYQTELLKRFKGANNEILITIANDCINELMGCYFVALVTNNFRFFSTLDYYKKIESNQFIVQLKKIVKGNNKNGIQGCLFLWDKNTILLILQYFKYIVKNLRRRMK